jgi:hypothetical protein
MSEDEFRTDLRWPTDPLGERRDQTLDGPRRPDGDGGVASEGADAPADDHDRGADRILERLRSLRLELDANLAEVKSEIAALRLSMSKRPTPALAPLIEELAVLRSVVEEVAAAVPPTRLDAIEDELAGVGEELVSLRRRITLRADAKSEPVTLADDQLEQIARGVAALLGGNVGRRPR